MKEILNRDGTVIGWLDEGEWDCYTLLNVEGGEFRRKNKHLVYRWGVEQVILGHHDRVEARAFTLEQATWKDRIKNVRGGNTIIAVKKVK